jgi:hypothetical protein
MLCDLAASKKKKKKKEKKQRKKKKKGFIFAGDIFAADTLYIWLISLDIDWRLKMLKMLKL